MHVMVVLAAYIMHIAVIMDLLWMTAVKQNPAAMCAETTL
jgi:hypothetical protein